MTEEHPGGSNPAATTAAASEESAAPQGAATTGESPVVVEFRLRVPTWMRTLWSMRRDRILLVGLALVAVALTHRVLVLREAYFVEDDFLFFARAFHSTLDWEYLTELHKGHLMPGAMLLIYVQTALAPYHWGLAAGVMVLTQAGASLGMFRLVWLWFGRRWAILIPLAVYTFAPLTLPVLAWWSAALNAVPLQLAMVVALVWLTHYLRDGTTAYAWYTAAAVVVGMSFAVKGMFLPPLLLAVAVLFLSRGSVGRSLLRTLDTHPRFWLGMVGLSVGHLLLYLARDRQAPQGEGAGMPEPQPAIDLATGLLGQTFPSLAVGGPLEWGTSTPAGGLVQPQTWVLVAAWSVLGLLVLGTLLYRRRAWRAWALLAGYLVLVDLVPTLIARGRYEGLVGHDPRYVAEAAVVFALCLALALWPTREEQRASDADGRSVYRALPRIRGRGPVAVLCTVGFVAAASYSTHTYADTLSGDRVRWYLDTVRSSISAIPPTAAVYPNPVPEDVVLPWNGPLRLSSHVLPPLAAGSADAETAELLAEPRPSTTPMMLNENGFLVTAEPSPHSHHFGPPEDEECVPSFDGRMAWDVHSDGGPAHAVGIAYSASAQSTLVVTANETAVTTVLPPAASGGGYYVPLPQPVDQLILDSEDQAVCVQAVTYGPLVPSSEEDPWSDLDEDSLAELEELAEEALAESDDTETERSEELEDPAGQEDAELDELDEDALAELEEWAEWEDGSD
ncbi:hypothetical protein RIF23_18055 [Lipingzhangella sp. LS1_29]|uniref:Dolichyl-phosphate-mannose-protein mannosyltransferase n=1 Tax=Lipingzhangella rawalii TaxID=2055835 RepID=A0ABU2HA92_9ACTN|nr:hypothetical protein [Lipingzhangella rawalii]MDS1272196.1 hypothetical protein [Lipingzhangella rawalii]